MSYTIVTGTRSNNAHSCKLDDEYDTRRNWSWNYVPYNLIKLNDFWNKHNKKKTNKYVLFVLCLTKHVSRSSLYVFLLQNKLRAHWTRNNGNSSINKF